MVLAIILLIATFIFTKIPPRIWPKTKPLCGCVPSFIWARLLGYGVFDWKTGELVTLREYFFEKHEWLCIFFGDDGFIPRRSRFFMLIVDLSATFSLNMVLTNADDEISGDTLSVFGVYTALYLHQLVISIALRLASIGAKEVHHSTVFRIVLFAYIFMMLTLGGVFAHLIADNDCAPFCVFSTYGVTFLTYEVTVNNILHPIELLFRYAIGTSLHWMSVKLPSDEDDLEGTQLENAGSTKRLDYIEKIDVSVQVEIGEKKLTDGTPPSMAPDDPMAYIENPVGVQNILAISNLPNDPSQPVPTNAMMYSSNPPGPWSELQVDEILLSKGHEAEGGDLSANY
eukprot:gene7591-9038_t